MGLDFKLAFSITWSGEILLIHIFFCIMSFSHKFKSFFKVPTKNFGNLFKVDPMGTYLPKVSLMSFKEGRIIDFPCIGPKYSHTTISMRCISKHVGDMCQFN